MTNFQSERWIEIMKMRWGEINQRWKNLESKFQFGSNITKMQNKDRPVWEGFFSRFAQIENFFDVRAGTKYTFEIVSPLKLHFVQKKKIFLHFLLPALLCSLPYIYYIITPLFPHNNVIYYIVYFAYNYHLRSSGNECYVQYTVEMNFLGKINCSTKQNDDTVFFW